MNKISMQELLDRSAALHSHLCPRQVLGVRMGMLGGDLLDIDLPQAKKRLLVIVESDGCFADGISAATGSTVGHRTLRVEDFGKIAAVFVDTHSGQAVRIAPRLDIRQRAYAYAPPGEHNRYFAQLISYQIMSIDELFSVVEVILCPPIEKIVARPGTRVNCDRCGEEIINDRQLVREGRIYCRACAGQGYYQPVQNVEIDTALTPITLPMLTEV